MSFELPPINDVVAKAAQQSSFIKANEDDHRAAYKAVQEFFAQKRTQVTPEDSSRFSKVASMLHSAGYKEEASQLLLHVSSFDSRKEGAA